MDSNKPLVNRQIIADLLFGDEDYIKEFAIASVDSFNEFKEQFKNSVSTRDDDSLRKAGHKIKPVAQMMQLDEILEIYEKSKELLEKDADDAELKVLTDRMDAYCNILLEELKNII